VIIEMDIYSSIRRRYENGESIRCIASSLGISRQTVKKYCEGDTHPEVRKSYERQPAVITSDISDFIKCCFTLDAEEHLKKQKHTAKRIFDRLVEEKQFTGSYSSIRSAVGELKAEFAIPSKCMVPLAYDPGEAIQVDWGEATIYLDGLKTKIYIFCGRLCFSCDIFVQAYKAQNQETFLEAQQLMFDYFGGVPKRVIFDNAKVAVKEGFGLYAKPQDKYLAFSAHYAFLPEFCNPAKGNEKGLVENLVGYSRRNFFVPVPRVLSLQDLNDSLLKSCLKYREDHKIDSKAETVKHLYAIEKKFLHDIPKYRYDTSKTAITDVDDFSTVKYDKNNYSVPVKYLHKEVTIKGYGNDINIMHRTKVIATYSRQYGRGETKYVLEHYIGLLEEKPRSVFNAKPVRENVSREFLEWGRILPGGNREMVKLLRLCVDYGEEKILAIKKSLPEHIVPTVDIIRAHLSVPVETAVIYLKNEIEIAKLDLSTYDRKYGVANQ